MTISNLRQITGTLSTEFIIGPTAVGGIRFYAASGFDLSQMLVTETGVELSGAISFVGYGYNMPNTEPPDGAIITDSNNDDFLEFDTLGAVKIANRYGGGGTLAAVLDSIKVKTDAGGGGGSWDHVMTQNIESAGYYISYDATNDGIGINSSNQVAIGGTTYAGALNIIGQVGTDVGFNNFVIGLNNFSAATGGSNNFISGSNNVNAAVGLSGMTAVGSNNFEDFNGSGGNSVAFGADNFKQATTGIGSSIGMGYKNFEDIGVATGSIGLGQENFKNVTGGTYNIGMGYQNVDVGLSTASYMTALGFWNLRNITTGESSFVAGRENFEATTNSAFSIGIGRENFENATTTILGNVGIGYKNFHSYDGTSYGNVGIGYENVEDATSGNYNVFIGHQTALTATDLSATNTVAIGYQALYGATSLDDQVAIGRNAGKNTTVANSVHLGDGSNAQRANEVSLGSTQYNYGRWDMTGQVMLAKGTTAQRQAATEGDFRYNTDSTQAEVYDGSAWRGIAYNDGGNVLNQYAMSYHTGGTNTDVDSGTPEQVNGTTTGSVSFVESTEEFTIQADGDIEYTGSDNSVLLITANLSIATSGSQDMYYYVAINGIVASISRMRRDHGNNDNGALAITFIDSDADGNDVYSIYCEPVSGTNESVIVSDAQLFVRKL
jgi:hypothetical protein